MKPTKTMTERHYKIVAYAIPQNGEGKVIMVKWWHINDGEMDLPPLGGNYIYSIGYEECECDEE